MEKNLKDLVRKERNLSYSRHPCEFEISFFLAPSKLQGVAITQEGSLLDETAKIEGWLARFPMFDWVGGRTSEMSAVGLLPAALQVSPFFPLTFSSILHGKKEAFLYEWHIGLCLDPFVSELITGSYTFGDQGIDIREMLAGAAAMDETTRNPSVSVYSESSLSYLQDQPIFSRWIALGVL